MALPNPGKMDRQQGINISSDVKLEKYHRIIASPFMHAIAVLLHA